MANSMATLSRKLYRSLLSNPRFSQASMSFCTNNNIPDFDELSANSDTESPHEPKVSGEERVMEERPLENGLDAGIYKVASSSPSKSVLIPIATCGF